MLIRSRSNRADPYDPKQAWQCTNKTHPVFYGCEAFVDHLIKVHKVYLQVPVQEKTPEQIARESLRS